MSDYVIETNNLSKFFGRKAALNNLSLKLPRGGVHAVIGSNGAGKSTLFRILIGVLSPSRGSSRILGRDSQALSPETRGRIGLVHEEHTLPGWMRVDALLRLHSDLYPQWDLKIYQDVLGHFNVLSEQRVSQLSRGERAGLSLAIALAQGPDLLILDEPTLGLDVVAKQAFLQSLLFVGGQHSDRTIVYCSHQMDEVERVADNLVILERGEMVSLSAPDEFCQRISCWVTEGLPDDLENTSFPGLLQIQELDGQKHLVVIDQSSDFSERLTAKGASTVLQVPLGLDQAVNAYLARNHAAPNP